MDLPRKNKPNASDSTDANVLDQIKQLFLDNYSPASEMHLATDFFSTAEVYNSIIAMYPTKELKKSKVAEWLSEEGFKLTSIGGIEFRWMVKSRSRTL